MSNAQLFNNDSRVILHFHPIIQLTQDQFLQFCQLNKELRIERASNGDIELMIPTGGETSWRNSELITALNNWSKQNTQGVVFDSSGGFILPDGATRSPDAARIRRTRLATLSPEQKKKFLPLCPDFVIELRSPTDSLTALQDKMQEYIDNGAQLGWLIDPAQRQISIYRPGEKPECLQNPLTISGEPLLSGFVLQLEDIWTSGF